MDKKLFVSALVIMMLMITLGASITANAGLPALKVVAAPTIGLLVVKVFNNSQPVSNALVVAFKKNSNISYVIPFNSVTQDYRRSIPSGCYGVGAFYDHHLKADYANISIGQTTTLYFFFP